MTNFQQEYAPFTLTKTVTLLTEIKIINYITCYTKALKYDAVPTLYIPSTTHIVIKESDTSPSEELIVFTVPHDERIVHQPINDLPKELQVQPATSTDETMTTVQEYIDLEKYQHIKTEEQLSTLENTNKSLQEKVAVMEENLKNLKLILERQVQIYSEKDFELSNLDRQYLNTKRSFLSLHDQKLLLSKVFSESQIKILSGKKKIYWSNDDMAVGYTIRHLSNKRCYMYLTKKLKIPLPAVSSIKRWMTLKNSPVKKSPNMTNDVKRDDEDDSD